MSSCQLINNSAIAYVVIVSAREGRCTSGVRSAPRVLRACAGAESAHRHHRNGRSLRARGTQPAADTLQVSTRGAG